MEQHIRGALSKLGSDGGIREKERRRRVRVALHWEIRFQAGAETMFRTRTENLSCEGFYCASPHALATGDYHCILVVPTHVPNDPEVLLFHCDVQVLRVDAQSSGRFGIAARIRDFHAAAPAR